MAAPTTPPHYRFDDVIVDCHTFSVVKGLQKKGLEPRAFDVLRYLIEHSDRVVEKQELFEQVWGEKFVTDNALSRVIKEIRHVIGDSADSPRYIETVPKRGYRFIAELNSLADREVVYTGTVEGVSAFLEEAEHVEDGGPGGEKIVHPKLPAEVPASAPAKLSPRSVALVLAAALLVSAASALVVYRSGSAPAESGTAPIRSIAVLPLENLSGDPAEEYFADGMTESLISNLAGIRALKVISRTSVMRYKGSGKSLPEIARELNVDAMVEGTVQRSNGRVRVTAQLIHAATDTHLWAREYERDLTDVLKLQGEVARAVADEIRIQVTAEERARLASARSVNPQAHEAYLLGRYHFSKGNEQGWKQAISYFERATQIAPDYAVAYAGLSDAWLQRGTSGLQDFKEAESLSRAAALKGIRLDEQLAEPHISLANIKYLFDWDWAGAEQEFRRALELDPGGLDPHIYYGYLLMTLGRHKEAIREGQFAVQLDPLSSATQSALGRFFYRARRYEEALPHLKRAVELEPRNIYANFRLGDAYTELASYTEAIAAYEKNRELAPQGGDFIQTAIARVYAVMGKEREARQMISGVEETPIIGKANPTMVARVYAALGDKDEAFRILEKAVAERSSLLVSFKEDPPFENLHSDPRWQALLRRMNFPAE
jgi:TolB-like protein/DNA-binding winged helix-turn-helix (wHTH) protein/Tfp pilus assembly protein PilF